MRVVRGKVVGQTIVVEEPLEDGTEVDVILRGAAEQDFVLTEDQARELEQASEEAEAGAVEPLDEVLDQLERELKRSP